MSFPGTRRPPTARPATTRCPVERDTRRVKYENIERPIQAALREPPASVMRVDRPRGDSSDVNRWLSNTVRSARQLVNNLPDRARGQLPPACFANLVSDVGRARPRTSCPGGCGEMPAGRGRAATEAAVLPRLHHLHQGLQPLVAHLPRRE